MGKIFYTALIGLCLVSTSGIQQARAEGDSDMVDHTEEHQHMMKLLAEKKKEKRAFLEGEHLGKSIGKAEVELKETEKELGGGRRILGVVALVGLGIESVHIYNQKNKDEDVEDCSANPGKCSHVSNESEKNVASGAVTIGVSPSSGLASAAAAN